MKKSVMILCSFLLFIFLLQLPFFGYIPFFGELISENKLTKYANETGLYDGKILTDFDSYFSAGKYKSQRWPSSLSYNVFSGYIHDEFYADKQSARAADDFDRAVSALSDDIDFSGGISGPSGFYMDVYIDDDDYSKTIHTLHMYSIINNSDISITEDESRTKAADIVWHIMEEMGEEYCFTDIQAVYYDSNGTFSIYADSMFNRELTYKDILRNTKKKP